MQQGIELEAKMTKVQGASHASRCRTGSDGREVLERRRGQVRANRETTWIWEPKIVVREVLERERGQVRANRKMTQIWELKITTGANTCVVLRD